MLFRSASIVLVGKRSYNTETVGLKEEITHADIIFKNKTDASVPATNSHGNEKIQVLFHLRVFPGFFHWYFFAIS